MDKLTIADLLSSKKVIPASELKAQKEAVAKALGDFEDAAIEKNRNQRFQSLLEIGSIKLIYRRESLEN